MTNEKGKALWDIYVCYVRCFEPGLCSSVFLGATRSCSDYLRQPRKYGFPSSVAGSLGKLSDRDLARSRNPGYSPVSFLSLYSWRYSFNSSSSLDLSYSPLVICTFAFVSIHLFIFKATKQALKWERGISR